MILYRDMLNIDPIHIDVQQPDDCESKMTGKKPWYQIESCLTANLLHMKVGGIKMETNGDSTFCAIMIAKQLHFSFQF